MAKQVSELFIKLGIQGEQELSALKSSFNELSKVTKLSETDLNSIRTRLVEFGREAGNTERVNRGLTDAFRGLLSEASRGSAIWQQLNSDLSKLRQEARLSDTELNALRDVILKEAKAHTQSAASIKDHIKSLQDLRNQASLNGKLYGELSADIQKLTATLDESTAGNRKHYSSLTAILAVKPDAVLNQWRNYTRILDEGTASAEKLAVAQRRLNQLSGAPRILARRRIAESAAVTQDPEYLRRFGFEGASLPELPNTNAAYAQQIKELQQDLANLDRTSVAYLQTVMQLAGVQRQATEVTRGYAQALLLGLNTNTVERSTRNLQEVITALRAEMQQLDVTTTEGAASYAKNANQVRNLEQELNKLANSYKHVGDMAAQAATAQQSAAGRSYVSNYLNRSAVRQQEAAYAELSQRIQQGVTGTPLMLPAAGQTSAPGTGLAYSGGARVGRATGAVQQIFAPGSGVGGVRFPGEAEKLQPTISAEAADRAKRSYISEIEARRAAAEATQQQEEYISNLRAAVDKATQANTGNIKSLNNLRDKLIQLREELSPTSSEFQKTTAALEDAISKLSSLDTQSGSRLTASQAVQAAGAVISGGIFGGYEGLTGGLLGAGLGLAIPALGPVSGAFAGSAVGGQLSMIRQQATAAATYAADISKLQVALQGITGTQLEYSKALITAATATKELNVPQETAIGGITRLSAAVIGAGGRVSDASIAFRAISEAIKATGGGAEQVDGAILALTQVFSKGKVSAEELNQIAERLPGTFTLFAKAAGKTGPELQKALQQGTVSLNDLMKFLDMLTTNYGKTALKIAASSADAGARTTVVFKQLQLDIGKAVQPLGAKLQDTFADFINVYAPAFTQAATSIASALTFIVVDPVVKDLATLALKVGLITAGFLLLTPAVKGLGLAFAFARTQVVAFTAALARNPYALIALAAVAAAVKIGDTVLEQKRLNTEVERTLSLASKQPAATVATQINAAQEALRKARAEADKYTSALTSDPFGVKRSGVVTEILRLEKLLKGLQNTYTARVELDTVFRGMSPSGTPTGYKVINGRLAYLSPGQGYIDAETGNPISGGRTKFSDPAGDSKTASSLLTLIEKREESIFEARRSHEEALADIRKSAIEQVQALERQFADQQRQAERDAARARRGTLAAQQDIEAMRLQLTGADTYTLEARQANAEITRRYEERLIEIEEQRADKQFERQRNIADFQKSVANQINKANESYAKQIGKIQSEYAKNSAKLIEEGSDAGAKRIELAAKLYGLYTERALRSGDVIQASGGFAVAAPGEQPSALKRPASQFMSAATMSPYIKGRVATIQALDEQILELETKLAAPTGISLSRVAAPKLGVYTANAPSAVPTPRTAAATRADQISADEQTRQVTAEAAKERAARFFAIPSPIVQQTESLQTQSNQLREQLRLLRLGINPERAQQLASLKAIEIQLKANLESEYKLQGYSAEAAANYSTALKIIEDQVNKYQKLTDELEKQQRLLRTMQDMRIGRGFAEGAQQYVESLGSMKDATAQLTVNGIKGLEDALMDLATTGSANFASFAAEVLKQGARMILQQLVLKPLIQGLANLFNPGAAAASASGFNLNLMESYASGGFAKGAAFAANGIIPYAMGGIVNTPTLFRFANGGVPSTGLMGEAGPEAIIPLRRGSDGKLGVAGGGSTSITINVDAKGSSAEGDPGRAAALGRVITAAVQAELVKQKRPGGLLSR